MLCCYYYFYLMSVVRRRGKWMPPATRLNAALDRDLRYVRVHRPDAAARHFSSCYFFLPEVIVYFVNTCTTVLLSCSPRDNLRKRYSVGRIRTFSTEQQSKVSPLYLLHPPTFACLVFLPDADQLEKPPHWFKFTWLPLFFGDSCPNT